MSVPAILAVIAIVLAVPPLVQFWFGRPAIRLEFSNEMRDDFAKQVGKNVKVLKCEVHNSPIQNRVLRLIGIHREPAQDVIANYVLLEQGTRRVVLPGRVPEIVTGPGQSSQRAQVVSSMMPAWFSIILAYKNDDDEIEAGPPVEPPVRLGVGAYVAQVQLAISEKKLEGYARFRITNSLDSVSWDDKAPVKKEKAFGGS